MRLHLGLEKTLKENTMSMKSAYRSLYIAIALLAAAIVLHVAMAPRHAAKETHEDVQLLAPDFNAETLGSVVVRNAHGVTTVYRSPEGWRIKEKNDFFAHREDIDTLVFALCSENARTTSLSESLRQEAGFPPQEDGATLELCDLDGNALAVYQLGRLLENHDNTPQKRYILLPDQRTATSQYLFPFADRRAAEWLEKSIPELLAPAAVTMVKNGVPEWQIAFRHNRYQLKTPLPEDQTVSPTAVEQVIKTLQEISIIDVLPEKITLEQSGQAKPVILVVTRKDGLIMFLSFGKTPQGLMTLQMTAETSQQSQQKYADATDTDESDEAAAIRRQALEKAAADFNKRYVKWTFLLKPFSTEALFPELFKLTEQL